MKLVDLLKVTVCLCAFVSVCTFASAQGGIPPVIKQAYVDVNAPTLQTDPDAGSIGSPARSISWAIATFKVPGSRMVVHVAPGLYEESINPGDFVGETWPILLEDVTIKYWDRANVLPAEPAKVELNSPANGTKTCFRLDGLDMDAKIESLLAVTNPVSIDSTKGVVINGFEKFFEVKDTLKFKRITGNLDIQGVRVRDCKNGILVDLSWPNSDLNLMVDNSVFYGPTIASGVSTTEAFLDFVIDSSAQEGIALASTIENSSFLSSDQGRSGPAIKVISKEKAICELEISNCSIGGNNIAPASVGLALQSDLGPFEVNLDQVSISDCQENGVFFDCKRTAASQIISFEASSCVFSSNGSIQPNGTVFSRDTDDSGVWLYCHPFSGGKVNKVRFVQCMFLENYTNGLRVTALGGDNEFDAFPDSIVSNSVFRANGADLGNGTYEVGKGIWLDQKLQVKQWKFEVQRSLFRLNSSSGFWANLNECKGTIYLTNCVVTESRGYADDIQARSGVFSTPIGFEFWEDTSDMDIYVECCTITKNKSPYGIALFDDSRSFQDSDDMLETTIGLNEDFASSNVITGNSHADFPSIKHWCYPVPTNGNDVLFDRLYGDSRLCAIEISAAPSGTYGAGSSDSDGNFWSDVAFKSFVWNNINFGETFPKFAFVPNRGTLIDQNFIPIAEDLPLWPASNPIDIRGKHRQIQYWTGLFELDPPPFYAIDIGAFELDQGE